METALLDPTVDYDEMEPVSTPGLQANAFTMPSGQPRDELRQACTQLEVDDCQCGYTLIRASAAADLPLGILWPRYGYPNDLLALLAREHKRVREVAVKPVYKDEKSGLHPGHVLSIALRILRRYALQGEVRAL